MSDTDINQPLDDLDKEIIAEVALEEKRRRGIKFLPNAITTSAMFFGFFSIMMAVNGRFREAAWALVAAGICDLLDGRVARLTHSTSAFGMEYDSLSDLIAFGFAPAMLSYFWALDAFGRLGWAVAFMYLACAAIRLAKFNTLTGEEESRRHFRGIPSPGAAVLIIIMVLMHIEYHPELYGKEGAGLPPDAYVVRGGMLIWVVMLSLLMVSNIRFRTFKDVNFKKYGPVFPLVGLAAVIAIFMARPEITLFGAGMIYLAIGLIEGGVIIRRREGELRMGQRRLRRDMRVRRKLEKQKAKQARKQARQDQEPPFRVIG
ncbi:MAG TPA: CDP-diacylglycerol--serine O-phosphatidyltransferase [bacterium]|nr:CDP-diacylglycerol--serine O-phosphatidyltransferase [bacterium]